MTSNSTSSNTNSAISNSKYNNVSSKDITAIIDHTNLNPWSTKEDILKLCEEAHKFNVKTVCVNESRVEDAAEALKKLRSKVKVCCVIGFPLGSCTTTIKVCSALDAIKNGAEEIDMVINIGFLKDGKNKENDEKKEDKNDKAYERFEDDIKAVMEAIDEYNKANKSVIILKVILENCYLTNEEIKFAASTIAKFAGEHPATKVFVKTSTGFGTPAKGPLPKKEYEIGIVNTEVGANIDDVELMKKTIDEITLNVDKTYKYVVGIKAAGGIRDRDTALKMMKAAGCFDEKGELKKGYKEFFRIGASATKEICK